MSKQMLRVGDTILCRANFGADAPKKEVVKHIDIDCVGGSGDSVEEVAWEDVKDRTVMVDMENGRWAYGSAIFPTRQTKRAQFKDDVEDQLDKALVKAKDKILKAINSGCLDIEQVSPFNVLALTSALLEDQIESMVCCVGNGNRTKFVKEVENINQFL
jgi:hypothetical protein